MAQGGAFERHPRLTMALFWLVLLVVLLAAAEAACRVYRAYWHQPAKAYFVDNPELGWVLNTRQQPRREANKCGEEVAWQPSPSPLLVRRPADGPGLRVLFLGDSFTHAHTVTPGQAYFDVFARLNPGKYRVFAAGAGGYGSVQEYLLLERLYPLIKPQVLLWQLSGNDPHNNVYELDRSALTNNSQRLRPYLDLTTGRIAIKDPRLFWFKYLCVSRTLFNRLLVLDSRFHWGLLQYVEKRLALPEKEQVALMNQGLEVLRRVLARTRKEFPSLVIVGFSVDSSFDAAYEKIFRAAGAHYLPRVWARVAQSPHKTNCLPLDPHWNHYGHQRAGEVISGMLAKAVDRVGKKDVEKKGYL